MPVRQRVDGPPVYRACRAEATVTDKEKRLIRLSFSSEEALVTRYGWETDWLERLGHEDGEVDLSFFDSGGAPVLWAHDRWSRSSMVGVVEKAWIENGKGYADVRLSGRDDVAGLIQDIADEIVRNVSVGYLITERTLVKSNKNGLDEYRVTSWKPLEISFVPVPADEGVGVGRSDDANTQQRHTVTNIEERAMPDHVQNPPAPPAPEQRQVETVVPPNPPPANDAATRAAEAATRAERERTAHIRSVVTAHGLDAEFERAAIDGGHDIATVNRNALEALATRQTPNNVRLTNGGDERERQHAGIAAWLLHRGNVVRADDGLRGNEFRGASLLDLARSRLELAGVRTRGLLNTEIASRAMSSSTSDFPVAMENVLHKVLEAKYKLASLVWRRFCRVGVLTDFRPHNRYSSGSFGDLDVVGEDNLFKYGTFPDAEKNSITARTRGKLVNLSRQMIVNDDLGVFITVATDISQGAARTVENRVFAVLLSNPTLGDSVALFDAAHGNLNASGSAPTMAAWDAVRLAMGRQKDVGANDFLGLVPTIWLGPDSLRAAAVKVNTSENDPDVAGKNAQPNTSRNQFSDIVDTPRLTGNQWYAFADPNESAVMEVGFLNGEQTPYTEMKEGFEADGVTWKVRLDFEAAAVGYRGAQKVTW